MRSRDTWIVALRMWLARLRGVFTATRQDAALDDDIRAHLDLLTEEFVARGRSPREAAAAARRAFGGIQQMREKHRDLRRLPLLDAVAQDLRHAVRSMRRSPIFAIAAIVTLALGVGATTAIIGFADAILLRPLPYPGIDRIVALSSERSILNSSQTGETFHYLKDRVRTLAPIAAHRGGKSWNLVAGNRAAYVRGLAVSADYFAVLGVAPRLGREFTEAEDLPNGPQAVILSDAVFRRSFADLGQGLGKVIRLGGTPFTVVGVMPEGFRSIPDAEVWTPLRVSPRDSSLNYEVFGRLRADLPAAAARAELEALKHELIQQLESAGGRSSSQRARELTWLPYQRVVGRFSRYPLFFLLTAAAFVLVTACANLAGLHIVRAIGQRREMATRAALGGGAGRAVSQVFTESALFGLAGSLAGLFLASVAVRTAAPLVGEAFMLGQDVRLDWRVLSAVAGTAIAASIAIGLWPALYATRLNLRDVLCGDGERIAGSPGTTWTRRGLIVAEVALACLLLTGAGLFGRGLLRMARADLGFDPRGVVIAQMSVQSAETPSGEPPAAFFSQTLDRIRAIPEVDSAAVGMSLPVARSWNMPLEPAGRITSMRSIDWQYITPQYFAVFRVPVLAGRVFDEHDDAAGAAAVVVNASFARVYFGDSVRALGQTIQLARALKDPPRQIVGVVGDIKAASNSGWTAGHPLAVPAAPTVYFAASQLPASVASMLDAPVSWVVRAKGEGSLVPQIQQAIRDAAPLLPIIQVMTMDDVIADSVALPRSFMLLLSAFAVIAVTMTSVGIYGLVAYGVASRRKEIGIRLALGATPARLLRSFLHEGLALSAAGVAVGLAAAAAFSVLTSRIFTVLFGIPPIDVITLLSVAFILFTVAAIAGVLPARRAAGMDPSLALRQ